LKESTSYSVIVGPLAAFGASVVSNAMIGPRIGGEFTTALNSTVIGTGVVVDKIEMSPVGRDSIIGDDSNEYAERTQDTSVSRVDWHRCSRVWKCNRHTE
jgi:hypothetical protein